MTSLTISPARLEGAEAIREVSNACFEHDYILDMLEAFLGSGKVLVAREDDEPAGFVKVERAPDGSSWLSALRVVPSLRRRGIGERLCRACEDTARREGSGAIRLWTSRNNTGAVGLFEGLSYRRVGSFTRWWAEAESLPSAPPGRPADVPSVLRQVRATAILKASGGYVPLELKFCRLDAALLRTLRSSQRLYHDSQGGACILDGEVWGALGEPMIELTLLGDDVPSQLAAAAGLAAERAVRSVGAFLPAGPPWDVQAEEVGLRPATWGRRATLYEKELQPAGEA